MSYQKGRSKTLATPSRKCTLIYVTWSRPAKVQKINDIHPCDLVSAALLSTVVQKVYLANKLN